MASVPWQALIDEFRLLRRDLAQTTAAHEQRMGRHETEMQVLQTLHEQRMQAHEERMEAHEARMHALETQTQDIKAILDRQDGRLIQAEETLKRITDLWEGRNRPQNGH